MGFHETLQVIWHIHDMSYENEYDLPYCLSGGRPFCGTNLSCWINIKSLKVSDKALEMLLAWKLPEED